MQYKTIVLELLQQFPEIHHRHKATRTLLATVEQLAAALKDRHENWTRRLTEASPHCGAQQIASAAMAQSRAVSISDSCRYVRATRRTS